MAKRRIHKWGAGKPGQVATSRDGAMILETMAAAGVRGNYKDYVLLLGNRLVDRSGAKDVKVLHDAPLSGAHVEVIHKRDLHRFIGEQALQYWDPRYGRVSPFRAG